MLNFLFNPIMDVIVGLLSGIVVTILIADTYYKEKIYKEKAKRFEAEEKLQIMRKNLQDVESKLYFNNKRKEEKAYLNKMMAYRKEINRKPMVFETVEHDGKIVACTGRLN